jgi:hypothetical protein
MKLASHRNLLENSLKQWRKGQVCLLMRKEPPYLKRIKRLKMHDYQPFSIIGFHSCDRKVGLRVLNGKDELRPSKNSWDWLGSGIYFWEQNPVRALVYAMESAQRKQFNKIRIKSPFVIGAIIDLGNCLNQAFG